MNQTELATCVNCGESFPEQTSVERRPCPRCGSTGRKFGESLNDGIGVSDQAKALTLREYYEKNVSVLIVVLFITAGAPLLGLWIVGIPGAILGLALGVIAFILGPKATIKVRETWR